MSLLSIDFIMTYCPFININTFVNANINNCIHSSNSEIIAVNITSITINEY